MAAVLDPSVFLYSVIHKFRLDTWIARLVYTSITPSTLCSSCCVRYEDRFRCHEDRFRWYEDRFRWYEDRFRWYNEDRVRKEHLFAVFDCVRFSLIPAALEVIRQ